MEVHVVAKSADAWRLKKYFEDIPLERFIWRMWHDQQLTINGDFQFKEIVCLPGYSLNFI